MKFSCNTVDICNAVTNVQRAVSTKSSLPALEGVLIQTNENQVIFSGYDLEIAIKTSIPADVAIEGCIVINAKILGEILRKLSGDKVTIEINEKQTASIVSGVSEFSIMSIDANEYPELPSLENNQSIMIESEILKSMVSQTIFAVSTSDIRPVHTGVLFEIEAGEIKLIAVDGCRLAIRKENIENDQTMRFIVPAKTLNEIIKLVGDEDKAIKFNVGDRHISFDVGEFHVISRLLEGEFLDYKTAIPDGAEMTVVASTREMINSIDRISLIITDRLKSPVRCTFNDNKAYLRCATTMGKASDFVDCDVSGEELEIGFNNKYFLDALKAVDCDKVKIELNGSTSPIKILPLEGDNFLFLVVPVRLKAE